MHTRVLLLVFISLLMTSSLQADERLSIGHHQFQVKLAITDEEHAHGLKQVKLLRDNQGMLFVYPESRLFSFWMKDTLIALDILFFDENGRLLEIIKNSPPCKQSPCIKYSNQHAAQFVLELAAGVSDKLNLKPGDVFHLDSTKDLH